MSLKLNPLLKNLDGTKLSDNKIQYTPIKVEGKLEFRYFHNFNIALLTNRAND